MNHYIYEIRNNINNKIYVGIRSCKCVIENDAYMGSGKNIKLAIKKYGIKNFTKRIIQTFETRDELLKREADIVNSEFVSRIDTYNMALGGQAGKLFDRENNPNLGSKRSNESKIKMSNSAKNRKWSSEGLNRRIEATKRMTQTRNHPDFSGSKNPAAKTVVADGLKFDTGRECANHFNISPSSVVFRIKNTSQKWDGWYYE